MSLAAALLFALQAAPAVTPDPLPTPGTVTVEPLPEQAGPAAVRQVYADGVQAALVDAGFLALPAPPRGRYVARFTVSRTGRGVVAHAGPPERAQARGLGISAPLTSSPAQVRALVVTELRLTLVLRADDSEVWTGSALTVQPEGSAGDSPAVLAPRLAAAALRGFPYSREEPVSVP